MRDVAYEAGILAGSVYHHFGSKDEILIEALRSFYDDTLHDMEAIVRDDARPVETVERLLALAVQDIIDRRAEARIIFNDFAHLRRLPAFEFINEASRRAEELWVGVLQRAIDANELRANLDPTMAYRSMMGAMFAAARWYDQDGEVKAKSFTRQVQRLYLDGVRATP
jgi:AcrR family transcriptional regulator